MTTEQIFFGPFRCDPLNACVWREDQTVNLPPKAFDVLLYLLRHPGRLVSKQELLGTLWPETYVTDAVLKVCIGEIRKVLADNPKTPQFIETIHRRGYRFIASSSTIPPPSPQLPVASHKSSPPAPSTQHLAPPLVGRDAELQRLHRLLEKAGLGERQVVFVTGEPGIGKTALVATFLSHLSTELGARVAQGQCLEHYGAGEAYLPVLDAFGRLCREPGREQLVRLLKQYAPTWLSQLPALSSTEERERLRHETLGATPERMLREMAEMIEALTVEAPLVLVLEDLHWSDYATLDLLGALARRRETARLLVIGTYRPVDVILSTHPLKGLKQELQGHGQCEEAALELLTPSQVAAYLVERFPESAPSDELVRVLHRRTNGNPLFLINFIEYLLGQDLLQVQGNHWELHGGIQRLEDGMPESIRQMIERQIEQLTPDEQQVLEAASVVGMEFTAAAVEAALEEPEGASEERCDRLSRQQRFLYAKEPTLWPDGTVTASYAFTHALYQNVLAQRVAVVRRLRFHHRIAERLARGYETQTNEIAAELAIHFEQGREYRRAIHYLRQAAEQAVRRYANREARQYLTHALGLAGKIPESEQADFRLALLEQRGVVTRAMGDMLRAAEDFSALAVAAQELKLVEKEISALSQLATVLSWINRDKCLEAEQRAALLSHDSADETLRVYVRSHTAYWHLLWRGWRQEDVQACADAVAVARRAGDQAQLGMQLGRLSFFLCLHSDYRAACDAGEEGLQLTREIGDVHNYLLCRIFLTQALLLSGRWGETLRMLREGSEMAERNGHQRWVLLLRLNIARVYEEAGDFVRARDLSSQILQQAQQMPLPYGQLVSTVTLGFAQLRLGQLQQAFEVFNGLDLRLAQERLLMDWIWQVPLRLGLGEYWITQQDYERARLEVEHLCEVATHPGERMYLALGRRLLAEIAIAQRKWEEAETALAQAMAVLAGAEAPLAEWRVYATAARVADLHRRKAQARRHWKHSKAVLLRLADSLEHDDPLRQTFLTQPLVMEIMQRG